jgi:2-keto-4-pentenoate hydratase/2-oxohepta-3-ene-1,7-dioic acid hydratase in catechol pathway
MSGGETERKYLEIYLRGESMKLASYVANGKKCFGVVSGDGVITMNARVGCASLREALGRGALGEIKAAAASMPPDHTLANIKFLPVITDPELIACAGVNYRAHATETGRDVPKQPSMFIRRTNTLVGHDGEMIRPRVSTHFDFEGDVKPENALEHVAGYTIFVDGSVRDYQKFSVTSGKNFPDTGPLGPWMVTTDELPDPTKLTLMTRLNGELMQKSATDLLIYSIPQIIAFCSDFTTLAPGDVIATGTPEGVGHRRNPPVWMKPRDVLEVEITGIGTLRTRIVDET